MYQENLDSFLVLAEELQLKGLRGNQTEKEAEVISQPKNQKYHTKSPKYRPTTEQFPANKETFKENGLAQAENEKAIALTDETTNNTDMESLDQQVKSMMMFSENADPYAKKNGRARICKVCGKEGSCQNIINHIEAHHIAGISIPCGLCGQVSKTRRMQRQHKSRQHMYK